MALSRIDSDDRVAELAPLSQDELVLARACVDELVAAQIGAGKEAVVRMYVQLGTVFTSKSRPESEEASAVEVYADSLQDIPLDILHAAFRTIVSTLRFFPTVAEIRSACRAEHHRRAWLISRLRWMIRRGASEPVPVELASPEDVGRIKREIAEHYASRRDGAAG